MGSGPISSPVIGAKKWYQKEESHASTFPWKIPAGGRGGAKGGVFAQESRHTAKPLLQQPYCPHSDLAKHHCRGDASPGVEGTLWRVVTRRSGSQSNKAPSIFLGLKPFKLPYPAPRVEGGRFLILLGY